MSLSLENVSVISEGQSLIDDVSLVLASGSMNVLLGPTLSGKTTLMRLMAGLDVPSKGRIVVDGRDMSGVPVRKRSVAMVYQQFVNYPTLSVYENIASPLRVAKASATEIEKRVLSAARLLGLEPLLKRMPSQISGGQQQRTAIARAIVKGADIVMLDEPLANLDYKLREELREELPRIFRESGSVLVYATTEPQEALLLGGNTATLSQGRVIEFGPTESIYHNAQLLASARVFSDPPLNEVKVSKRGDTVRAGDVLSFATNGQFGLVDDGDYTMAFRADIVRLGEPWQQSIGVQGRVKLAEISGSESFVHVETAIGTFVCVEIGVSKAQPGDVVDLQVDATRIFIFDQAGRRAVAQSKN